MANPEGEKASEQKLTFGRFVLDLNRGCLLADGREITLRPKTFAVLHYLVAHPGRLISKEELLEHFEHELVRADEQAWDARTESVVARRVLRLGGLIVEEKPLHDAPREASAAAMLEGLRSLGLDALPWDDDSRDFLARAGFVGTLGRSDLGAWPDFRAEALVADLGWIEPFLDGITRRSQLSRVPLLDALRARLDIQPDCMSGRCQRAALASATVSAVMFTIRRTVADGVSTCTGSAAPSSTGPMAMPPPAAVLSRL